MRKLMVRASEIKVFISRVAGLVDVVVRRWLGCGRRSNLSVGMS